MPEIKNGAELVKKLKESGTGDSRLAPARECLTRVKGERGEVASSAQVVAALESAYGADHMTVVKAKALAATGEWAKKTPAKPVAIEDELLGTASVKLDGEKPADGEPKPDDDKSAVPLNAGTVPPKPAPPQKPPTVQKAIHSRQINSVKPIDTH